MQSTDLALALGSGFVLRKFTLDYRDLTTAGTSQAIPLFTMGPRDAIMGVRIKHTTRYLGGSLASMTVSVGSAIDGAAGYATAFDIFQALADTALQMSQCFKNGTAAAAGQAVNATFTGSHNVNTATAGQVEIDVLIMRVSTP